MYKRQDSTVSVQNSLLFAGALANKKVPFELHIYPYGEHGLSLATKEVEEPEKKRYADAHVAGWFGPVSYTHLPGGAYGRG